MRPIRLPAAAALVFLLTPPAARAADQPWENLPPISNPGVQTVMIASGGSLYLLGGVNGTTPSAALFAYSPKRRRWTKRAPMPTARWSFAGGASNGRLYAAGGMIDGASPGTFSAALEIYDPARDAWSRGADMPSTRNMDGTVLDGKLYVAGGNDHGQCTSRAEEYDPATDSWRELPPLPTPRCSVAAAAYGGRLYVLGGTNTSGSMIYATVEIYDPRTNAWTTGPPMPTARGYLSAAVLDGRIYALGGANTTGRAAVESLDPATGEWFSHAPLPEPRLAAAAAALEGRIYLAGGALTNSTYPTSFLAYDPRRDKTIRKASSPPPEPPPAVLAPPDVDGVAGRAAARPDDYALVVGIDGYRSVPHAAYGEGDAVVFARYARQVLGVPEENVILLTGEKATRTDLAKYLEEWLPRNVAKDSRVYFFYSGHGAPDPEQGTAYLVPWDGDPEFLRSSAYPLARLYDQLDALAAKEVIVFLDSCFSGAGGRSLIAKNLRPLVTVVATPRPGHKLSLLTAAAGGEVAGSSDQTRHGLFTYYLLKGLQGEADARKTGHVDLGELHAYVEKNVLKAAHRDNREQHPALETSRPGLRLY